ncbi:MAG: hypothetical protein AAGH92_06540 [Planctomycetota bacterium]
MQGYEAIRPRLKTGDVVLFSGRAPVSRLIQWVTGGPWSHVGLIVRLREFDDAVMLWESTTLTDVSDVQRGRPVRGVQLVPLSQRLVQYDGDVAVRQLHRPLTFGQRDRLAALRHRLSRRPYEQRELELLRSAIDLVGPPNREDLSSVFCSELVAEAYQAMGLLAEPPDGPPSNEYTPMDFAEARSDRLSLRRRQRLGPEITVGQPAVRC